MIAAGPLVHDWARGAYPGGMSVSVGSHKGLNLSPLGYFVRFSSDSGGDGNGVKS